MDNSNSSSDDMDLHQADQSASGRSSLLSWIQSFDCFKHEAPTTLQQLSDGVALFEMATEMCPSYFDKKLLKYDVMDNVQLKSANLKRLMQSIEEYHEEELGELDEEDRVRDTMSIAETPEHLLDL